MRTFIYGSLFTIVAGLLSGCGSNAGTKPDPSSAPQAEKAADGKDFVMQSGGMDVLKLRAPAGTKCVAEDGSLKFDSPKYYAEVWLVRGAKTVEEAMGRVSEQITSEFKNFKPDETTDLTIAGSPAKRTVGVGE